MYRRSFFAGMLLGLFLQAGVSFSQAAQDLSDKQKQCFANRSQQLGLNPSFAYQHRINVSAHEQLKKNGVDLQQMARRWNGGFTPLEQVLLSDNLVKAKVIGIEEAPASQHPFKIIYQVQVLDNLAGQKLPDRIELYSRSSGGNGSFFSYNNEPVLQIGEEAVLYLTQLQIKEGKPAEQSKPKPLRYEEISLKPTQATETKTAYLATVKYNLKNGNLVDAWGRSIGTEKELKKLAGKISKLNAPQKFYTRNYCP